jgi:DNA repair exonuclease SbcCD ATPase subunit
MCNIPVSAPCKTDNINGFLNVLLGWAEELQTLRKQCQESEIRLSELQEKYRAAKKIARRYKLWADGKEKHLQQEWQRIAVGFQNVLQVVHDKAQAALTFTDGDSAVAKQLDEQLQALQDRLVQYTSS